MPSSLWTGRSSYQSVCLRGFIALFLWVSPSSITSSFRSLSIFEHVPLIFHRIPTVSSNRSFFRPSVVPSSLLSTLPLPASDGASSSVASSDAGVESIIRNSSLFQLFKRWTHTRTYTHTYVHTVTCADIYGHIGMHS